MPCLKMFIVAKLSCLKMVVVAKKACLKLVIVAKISCLKMVFCGKQIMSQIWSLWQIKQAMSQTGHCDKQAMFHKMIMACKSFLKTCLLVKHFSS